MAGPYFISQTTIHSQLQGVKPGASDVYPPRCRGCSSMYVIGVVFELHFCEMLNTISDNRAREGTKQEIIKDAIGT